MRRSMNKTETIEYLVKNGLINRSEIQSVKISDMSRRNNNKKMMRKNEVSYFIKQPYHRYADGEKSFLNEILFYSLVKNNEKYYFCRSISPALIHHEIKNHILIIEFINKKNYINHKIYQKSFSGLRELTNRSLGKSLALLHHSDYSSVENELYMPRNLPILIKIVQPTTDSIPYLSPANFKLLKIIHQDTNLFNIVESFKQTWKCHTLIHGDMRLDNIITFSRENKYETIFIDWEYATYGDPAWDVGCVFQEYLIQWIQILDTGHNYSLDQTIENSNDVLNQVLINIRQFWKSYKNSSMIKDPLDFLKKCIFYCSARLIQTSYEIQEYSIELMNSSVLMLQLASNLVRQPKKALMWILNESA